MLRGLVCHRLQAVGLSCWSPSGSRASAGFFSGDKPGFFDFVGLSKYEAWERLQGMGRVEAMKQYVELVRSLGATLD